MRLGLCEDYPEETRSIAAARRDLEFAQSTGARVLRIAFGWDAIEPRRGEFDWTFWDEFVALATEHYSLQLIPYVCYTPRWAAKDTGENFWRSPPRDPADFARFMTAMVQHYQDRIHSWELWNEPDNSAYWLGSRAEFAALIRAGSTAVRETDASARVVLGGIATDLNFLEGLMRDEHLAPAIDVVNVHSYLETWHSDPLERLPDVLNRAAQIIREQGKSQPLWLAETGYSSVGPRSATSEFYRPHFTDEHTELAQAEALARTVVLAAASEKVATLAWYRINDLPHIETVIGDDNNRYLGLRTVTGKRKIGARVFSNLATLFAEPYRNEAVNLVSESGSSPVEAHLLSFRNGRRVLAVWNAMPGSAKPSEKEIPDSRRQTVRLGLAATAADFGTLVPVSWSAWPAGKATLQRRSDGADVTLTLEASHVAIYELQAAHPTSIHSRTTSGVGR